ncbi:hypothetical protein ACWDTP_33180 [Mycobacterium sp. NPDC003449]
MKKFAVAVIAASGLSAAAMGLAGPAQAAPAGSPDGTVISAGVDRLDWLDKIQPKVNVPKVDTTVRHSGR